MEEEETTVESWPSCFTIFSLGPVSSRHCTDYFSGPSIRNLQYLTPQCPHIPSISESNHSQNTSRQNYSPQSELSHPYTDHKSQSSIGSLTSLGRHKQSIFYQSTSRTTSQPTRASPRRDISHPYIGSKILNCSHKALMRLGGWGTMHQISESHLSRRDPLERRQV